jgi:formylglycine-generating enzyme required for sulfatase activity
MPAGCLEWKHAAAYCEYAGGRLPTEAEWEYAARGGLEGKIYPWGDDKDDQHQWANLKGRTGSDTYRLNAPGKQFKPNAFGLYDMAGNIAEWCSDWFDETYFGRSPSVDPGGPDRGVNRSVRGGARLSGHKHVRASARYSTRPQGWGTQDLGMRCVVEGVNASQSEAKSTGGSGR